MTRVGFVLFGGGKWNGGLNYLKTSLRVIKNRLANSVETIVFLSPGQKKFFECELAGLSTCIIADDVFEHWGRGMGAVAPLLLGRSSAATRLIKRERVEVVVENACYIGWNPQVGVLAWMPDFQHAFIPSMFSTPNWLRREAGFRLQIASHRRIMVSSETARGDCERLYPSSRGRISVVRFASEIDPAQAIFRGRQLVQKFELPRRFLFLPNQFWSHKNHQLVVDALALLKLRFGSAETPVVVATGQPDSKQPKVFQNVMENVRQNGLDQHFRHLGHVAHYDVLGLIAASEYVINPSRFEGWSTPVEEAKALGTSLLLSDLPVHREQAPDAQFFSTDSLEELASLLENVCKMEPVERALPRVLLERQEQRAGSHAAELHRAILASLSQNSV